MKTDVKEAHSAQRIMKDTEGAKAQEAQCAAVRALHNILRQAAFRLWCKWTGQCAARARVALQYQATPRRKNYELKINVDCN